MGLAVLNNFSYETVGICTFLVKLYNHIMYCNAVSVTCATLNNLKDYVAYT